MLGKPNGDTPNVFNCTISSLRNLLNGAYNQRLYQWKPFIKIFFFRYWSKKIIFTKFKQIFAVAVILLITYIINNKKLKKKLNNITYKFYSKNQKEWL